ncbi:hypothetical protein [Flavobacterium pectinovorum]|uniref:Uncharacterized protein n=1 Tax=Flavobacterium pectinovorum TaxID=29533 RepID=A0A502F796_9FLAO|nr:hypothetical protein [Flavobacterium pectinovorum]TPG45230.1 hypothetical protein EAH81_01100 [Flavobacterium pectinovorum]
MIQLKKIESLSSIKNTNNRIQLKFRGWEERSAGQMIVYHAVLIDEFDRTKELFGEKEIQCSSDEKIEIEHPTKNFGFIASHGSFLINPSNYSKTNLDTYHRVDRTMVKDSLVGSFFYSDFHLLINKRSLVVTDLATLEKKRIKFNEDINIEWAYFINSKQIQIIQAFSNLCFIYDLEEGKIINQRNIVDENLYPNIFRWIYRGQQYNSNHVEMELLQRNGDQQSISTYFEIM